MDGVRSLSLIAICLFLMGCSDFPDSQTSAAPEKDLIQSAATEIPSEMQAKIQAALAKLSDADRALAKAQKFCPVLKAPLGTMGTPNRIEINGQPVFLCCAACADEARADPKQTLRQVAFFKKAK